MAILPSSTELLLHVARVQLEPEREARVRALLAAGLDWAAFLGRVATYRLDPLAHRHLSRIGVPLVPAEALDALTQRFHSATRKALLLGAEAARLGAGAAEAGVRVLVLKGSALAVQAYGSAALRSYGDIDLLVDAADLPAFEAVLAAQGYEAEPMPALKRRVFLLTERQYAYWQFVHWERQEGQPRGRKMAVEVHLRVMPPGYTYRGTVDELWERSVAFAIGGREARTLAPEDHLMVACLHGFKNRWKQLKYACDVAELARAHPNLDWAAVAERARRTRTRRVLHLGLLLARDLLEAPIPDEVLDAAQRDTRARALADEVETGIVQSGRYRVDDHAGRFRFILRAQDGWRGRLAYASASALRHLVAPIHALP